MAHQIFKATENGVEIDATQKEIRKAIEKEILYYCPECTVYHITPGEEFKGVIG